MIEDNRITHKRLHYNQGSSATANQGDGKYGECAVV